MSSDERSVEYKFLKAMLARTEEERRAEWRAVKNGPEAVRPWWSIVCECGFKPPSDNYVFVEGDETLLYRVDLFRRLFKSCRGHDLTVYIGRCTHCGIIWWWSSDLEVAP